MFKICNIYLVLLFKLLFDLKTKHFKSKASITSLYFKFIININSYNKININAPNKKKKIDLIYII